jgi:hypothetical protein
VTAEARGGAWGQRSALSLHKNNPGGQHTTTDFVDPMATDYHQ